ncbi:MAG: glutathione-disulfide reductase [Polyangiaceae bacterium]|jgi:glutathione reductase (NADPH)|nr:glutathione-disulfide reductase [Polyangiaceae bacterium]MBK8939029.1 glutathione-disulfide reductase [Polyangiaceae bacterium]
MPHTKHDFDLFVVGGGSAGVRAARVAASLGARVALCEDKALGGTCVNVGCVPKKLMVLGAHFADEWRDAAGFGWSVEPPRHDWQRLISNKDAEIARLNGVYARLLQDRGVKVWMGRARIAGAHRVEVVDAQGGSTVVTAHKVLVATGGEPVRPNVPGSERVWVSDDIFHLPEMPARVLVVGGGYIAVELAGVFAGYGASVTQIYRGALFLRGFDRDVRAHLDEQMRKKGIDLRFHRDLARVDSAPSGALAATLDDGSTLEVDGVLAAIGRVPRSSGMGLEEAGVELDARGAVRVDASFQTSVPWIYAAGDVIDRVQLTPVALAEGTLIAQHLFGGASRVPDYDLIPSAVFSNPPIATVGMTEEEARAELGAIDVYKSTFTAMKATLGGRGDRVLMKLVVERSTDRVVGVHMVGADAAEILQGFAVALRCGATKAQFDATIGIHPSAAEELVTLRERCQEPDHAVSVTHPEGRTKRVVHHRWERGSGS